MRRVDLGKQRAEQTVTKLEALLTESDDMPRPRTYHRNRVATNAERQQQWRHNHATPAAVFAKLAAHFPAERWRQIGSCFLLHSAWEAAYHLLPRHAAVVSDPPYMNFDSTKDRRRPSQWDRPVAGYDQPFDPSPWLPFTEVILFGADHYRDTLPRSFGDMLCWDKVEGKNPGHFAPAEWAWSKTLTRPTFISWQWRGGMRRGKGNIVHLPKKHHPQQKPEELMGSCLTLVPSGLLVIDPFVGGGTTCVAAVTAGRPCIGIDIDEQYYQEACAWVAETLQQLALFA
jgi:site-specific DNA-methyltransferase (adenine-specific)/modification methylase